MFVSECVEKTQYDALQKKLDDTTKELSETKSLLKKSQDQLTDLQAHRYQTFMNAGRTWRLDSAKGSSCILLTSNQDWKNGKTMRQSCACEDFYRDNQIPSIEAKSYGAFMKQAKALGCE